MSAKTYKKKAEQLGMPPGTAANQLRKNLLFHFLSQLGLSRCYRCDGAIESPRDLSVEHKIAWLDSVDPVGLFFDLENVTFSHLSCNSSSVRRPKEHPWDRKQSPEGTSHCSKCGEIKPLDKFQKRKSRWNGVNHWCKACSNEYNRIRRQ